MALVGEAAGRCNVREAGTGTQQSASPIKPAHDEIVMRTCSEGGTEMPRQRETVEVRDLFKPCRTDRAMAVVQALPDPLGCREIRRESDRPCSIRRERQQRIGYPKNDGIPVQLIEWGIERSQPTPDRSNQPWIRRDGGLHEGQCSCGLAKRRADQTRLQIKHSVEEAAVDAGATVMNLVRMEHDGIAGQTVLPAAAIVERLHARQSQAERIGIMPVRIVGVAAEEGLDALDTLGTGTGTKPIARQRSARSFKTAGCRRV